MKEGAEPPGRRTGGSPVAWLGPTGRGVQGPDRSEPEWLKAARIQGMWPPGVPLGLVGNAHVPVGKAVADDLLQLLQQRHSIWSGGPCCGRRGSQRLLQTVRLCPFETIVGTSCASLNRGIGSTRTGGVRKRPVCLAPAAGGRAGGRMPVRTDRSGSRHPGTPSRPDRRLDEAIATSIGARPSSIDPNMASACTCGTARLQVVDSQAVQVIRRSVWC